MERKLDIVITMAGIGSRFRSAGYTVPKYMIEAKGRTLFEWSMESLTGYRDAADKYIFIVRKDDRAGGFIRRKCAAMGIDRVYVLELDHSTDGQATTALLGNTEWNRSDRLRDEQHPPL